MKRGISRIIALVILVVIAITIGIAAAYWLYSVAAQSTRTENIKIFPSSYAEIQSGNLRIWLEMRNYGTSSANIVKIWINGHPFSPSDPSDEVAVGIGDYLAIEIVYPLGGVAAQVKSYDMTTHTLKQDADTWVTTQPFTLQPPVTIMIEAITSTGNTIKTQITIL